MLQLVLLVFWTRSSTIKTKASIAANAVSVAGAVAFVLLAYAEHVYSVKPSFLLNIYLLLSLIFDTARARTLWLRDQNDYNQMVAMAFSVAVGLKFVILLLEAAQKRGILRLEYQSYPPEATSGIFNRSFFLWLNSLFWAGFSKLLGIDDLFVLDKHLLSERVHDRMQERWSKGSIAAHLPTPMSRTRILISIGIVKKKKSNSLLVTVFRTLKWPLLSIALPRLCLIGFNFSQPFLINRAISLSTEPDSQHATNVGYGLIFAYVIAYTGIAVCPVPCHLNFRFRSLI